ncbi:MAG: hypothetical protein JNK40_15765 [Chromatiales bacterium]|nr:hypothetical protein [Chromatiales bacterium]
MTGAMSGPWKGLSEFSDSEQNKLRFILRDAANNGIVEAGVACKYGREWRVNTDRLPDYLLERTRLALHGHASQPPRNRRRGDAQRTSRSAT